jgi:hypothetical protein
MHGDFAPWNLREQGGDLFLFDFEHVGWAPSQSDLVFYAAASAAMGLPAPSLDSGAVGPAIEYWLTRLPRRMGPARRDQLLLRGMVRYLQVLSTS